MILLLTTLWPELAGAAVLGLATGILAGWPSRPAIPAALCIATAFTAAAAMSGAARGVPGLWLDDAALMLPLYVAGCATGALLKRLVPRR